MDAEHIELLRCKARNMQRYRLLGDKCEFYRVTGTRWHATHDEQGNPTLARRESERAFINGAFATTSYIEACTAFYLMRHRLEKTCAKDDGVILSISAFDKNGKKLDTVDAITIYSKED